MSTTFPLGMYSSNPNGNDSGAMATFHGELDSFMGLMGATPRFMNTFTDFSRTPDTWESNANWSAWSWRQSGRLADVTPVVGVPLSDGQHWDTSNGAFFQAILAGAYDSAYTAICAAWLADRDVAYFRLGYEMNANFMPWACGSHPELWMQAFQYVATLMRTYATAQNKVAKIVWNPCCINWSQVDVRNVYPGDDYVDTHGVDVYSPTWPAGFYDWSGNNKDYNWNAAAWAADVANREHYWQYQNANQWNPQGQSIGWGLQQALDFAKLRGKPMMVCECGSGGNDSNLGPVDDGAFPPLLARVLEASGVPIEAVMIWCTDQSDGNWGFLNGDRPAKAATWASSFGAAKQADSIPAGFAVAELTDRNGNYYKLTFDPTLRQNFYGNDTGLLSNVYVWPADDGSGNVISPDNGWALPTIKLHGNGCNIRAEYFSDITTD